MTVETIILSYNNEKTIQRSLESILTQKSDTPIFISVYDDCSTDGTRDVLDTMAAKYENIKRIYNPVNLGWARNFIQSFEKASGDYLTFLDGDDYWSDPEKIQKQLDIFRQNPSCSLVHTAGIIRSKEGDIVSKVPDVTAKDMLVKNSLVWITSMVRGDKKDKVTAALKKYWGKYKSEPVACDYIALMELVDEGVCRLTDVTAVHMKNKGSVSHPQLTGNVIKRHYRTAMVRLDYNRKLKCGMLSAIMIIVRSIRRLFVQLHENKQAKNFA